MRLQSNPITPHETWLDHLNCAFFSGFISISFYRRYSIQSCSGRFMFLHWSTLPSFLAATERKTLPLVLFWARALQRFYFFTFSFMAYANLATSPKRLETKRTNITRRHFCSLTIFCIEHSFIYFLFSEFFLRYLFVLTYFDSSRRHTHATTHATRTQIVRAKMASLDAIFCRGNKSSSRSLALLCSRKH